MAPRRAASAAKAAMAKPAKTKALAKSDANATKVAAAKKEVAKKAASVAASKGTDDSTTSRPKRVASVVSRTTSIAAAKKTAAPKKTASPKKAAASTTSSAKALAKSTKRKADDSDDEPKAKRAKKDVASAITTKKTAGKATAKKAHADTKVPKKAAANKKVAADESEDEDEGAKPVVAKKKPGPKPGLTKKVAAPKKVAAAKPAKPAKVLPQINTPPTIIIDVFAFGEGSAGELGLGAKSADGKKVVDVTRPRLNPRLSAKLVGVVLIAVGGMHCAALTHDNKILTWGVNDQGSLGRETSSGPMKEIKEGGNSSDSDSDDDDVDLNPSEAEPREVDPAHFPAGTKFAALYAGDSSTFALTTTGLVYGWGTFRANDGILGFRTDVKIQKTPMLIPELKNITSMAMGTNHVLALNNKGKVFTWGAGEQHQLARRIVARTATGGLVPREFGLSRKNIVQLGAGDYHSFVVDKKGDVYSWGLNTFGQTGIPKRTGEEEDTIAVPTVVENLQGYEIAQLAGGAHHTLARTEKGEALIWGRIDTNQGGMEIDEMPKESIFFDEHDKPRYLKKPLPIPDIEAAFVATANDTCIVVDTEGKAHSWGFSSNYQTGQGTDSDVVEATWIDNTAVRGKKLIWAGLGGQFGMLGGETILENGVKVVEKEVAVEDVVMTNGVGEAAKEGEASV